MFRSQSKIYDRQFFDAQAEQSLSSARAVVPLILGLVPVDSVVDFGCGRGTWLQAFTEAGVGSVLGLDGDHVAKFDLAIGREQFRGADLMRPVELGRRFDLALCLEVAEHLPRRAASTLIDSLTSAAPLILFSAAVPGQGGTAHINEQWPEYWERFFACRGYRRFDTIRPLVWQDRRIAWWYRQNFYLYADEIAASQLRERLAQDLPALEPDVEIVGTHILNRYKSLRGLMLATAHTILSRLSSGGGLSR